MFNKIIIVVQPSEYMVLDFHWHYILRNVNCSTYTYYIVGLEAIKNVNIPFFTILTVRLSGNGYIEGSELDSFLREFVASMNATDSGEVSIQFVLRQCHCLGFHTCEGTRYC